MLKAIVDNMAEVPGHLRDHYQQTDDGRFALVFDGKDKLAEFRNRNIDLLQKLDKLGGADAAAKVVELAGKLAAFDGVDPEEYRALKARPDTSKRAAELETELSNTKAAHAAAMLKNAISVEFLRQGGRASAVDFMVQAASQVFEMGADGVASKQFSAADPSQPLSVSEWIGQQAAVADFAFQPSRGGGAPTRKGTTLGGRSSSKELRNPTPQQLGEHAASIASGEIKIVVD